MKYREIVDGIFLDRPNRFIAHVGVNGTVETVHVKNTGRCKELLLPGTAVRLEVSDNPKRKTKYDLVAVRKQELGWVNMDSQAPNKVVGEWLSKQEFDLVRPEFAYGKSRIDFYMEKGEQKYLLEVKGCTLEVGGIGYFPDAPTERGVKHLHELAQAQRTGYQCAVAFVIQMEGITEVRPNVSTQPEFSKMMTVNEVSKRTGVSIRTLQYYDKIGLLRPVGRTEAGYRLYDDAALERLQQILLFRELEFPLKDIQKIVENPAFDRQKALEQQITLLTLKKQHLENLIGLAQKIRSTGGMVMDFTAFDTQKIKKYTEQAKKEWGETPEYKEFEEKTAHKTEKEVKDMSSQLMDIVVAFGGMQSKDPADPEVQAQVKKLQEFITEHYYNCSKVILNQLGQMYGAGGAFTENINAAGGAGAAEFAQKAIEIYCK